MGKRGYSINRKKKRGKADMFGRPLQKRPYNNSKHTKGRKGTVKVKKAYEELMKRAGYIKYISKLIKDDDIRLTDDNWKKIVRSYDKHELIFDDIEKDILFSNVNN